MSSSPVHYAAQGGHLGFIRALSEQEQFHVDVTDVRGHTALHTAAWHNSHHVIEPLLSIGAKLHALTGYVPRILNAIVAGCVFGCTACL